MGLVSSPTFSTDSHVLKVAPAMPNVLIAAELQELLPSDPVPGHEVRWIASTERTPAGDYAGVVPLLSRKFGDAEFTSLPALEVLANCAVGFDNIDLAAAGRHGVIVTNTPDVLTESTADLAWALILAAARRLKEAQALVAEGQWVGWDPRQLLGLELHGATLGLMGAGRIGQAVARRAVGFGMSILYTDPHAKIALERTVGARRVSVEELLAASDVVSLHVPSSAETRGMVDADWLARMRPGAILVNTARGDLVDETALLAALDRGHLWAAGLDVYANEPRVPAALVEHPRVITLPHIGSATTVTRLAMAALAVRNVREVLAGRTPVTPVPLPR